ncbi:MAG: chromosome segregation protein SMC [Pirellula sp.]|jgi:chromosome segregation protein
MLKALELVGFKSFADRTRFDFPDGITVVVGPNGSGKSNVVDAVKWVLGSQSAKALRGSDMADVIFKGSAAGGRRPSNSAEVTLILDNSKRTFHHDSDEVHVTRRVFRSGDTEYCINGENCRLKDVKDLFRGTGVGVDAYSLIEQGKVDRLLQASAKDRRGIFEEAAGISRFKAKKVEAERRLLRVDQNLLRLSDIVDEVGRRLSTLKGQATKAQRYREISQQLFSKRSQLGYVEYQILKKQQANLASQIASAEQAKVELTERLKGLQESADQHKTRLLELQAKQTAHQQQYLDVQKQTVSAESGYHAALQRIEDLNAEKVILQERLKALQERATLGTEESQARERELLQLEDEKRIASEELLEREAIYAQSKAGLIVLENQLELITQQQNELGSSINELRSKIVAYQLHVEEMELNIEELTQNSSSVAKELENHDQEFSQLKIQLAAEREIADSIRTRRRDAELQLELARSELFKKQESVSGLQSKLHGVRERLQVLEQLEDQFTAAGRGGQQLLRLARANQSNPNDVALAPYGQSHNTWDTVHGLIADLLSSEMHIAPLIDVALGNLADAIVLTNGLIVDWINEGGLSIEGRVTLLRLDRLPNRRSGEKIELDGLRGIIGRADRLTSYDPKYEPLMRSLLGTTWFVDSLATALELSHFRGAGLRFVTAECQLVDSDGSITIGALQAGLGLISRRTEMQIARDEIAALERALAAENQEFTDYQTRLQKDEINLKSLSKDERDASHRLSKLEAQLESSDSKRNQILQKIESLQNQLTSIRERVAERRSLCENTERQIAELESKKQSSESDIAELRHQYQSANLDLQTKQSDMGDQRVQLARLDQRLEGLRTTLIQLKQDATEREKNADEANLALGNIETRMQQTVQSSVEFEQRMESARQVLQQLEIEQTENAAQWESQNGATNEAIRACDSGRRQLEKNEDKILALQSSHALLDTQVTQLIERYSSEYRIDLPIASEANDSETTNSRDLVSEEISEPDAELLAFQNEVAKISSQNQLDALKGTLEANVAQLRMEVDMTGSVNMEALAELDELQSRFDRLSGHQSDLNRAKSELLATMTKIDEDSRHIFIETLESIRANFQDLYRRSFGGGFADIVLENPSDPDSGIEIVATPPGKTTLSNSLLSGGEKALTAVALIMAFFQYRPSPFCILDEVDAPFDEANIGRFVTVLREFLDSTKFIVVSHSKKTMTAANMIYGVTMQESGVSRQVSVRFEEVNEKGEIIHTKIKRAA